ncbi:right-handed parallel beta-helix repeat-containing protein [Motilimonas pumila]|uniref:Right-handed parallel beta-helix repeat-containing protein n=2 Tax=Motilimonas pumila TaxID=2303987 RepID=A0A418Y9P7_9GAMM|nr:right-handed parallel beta-helix repeat-containing protein [Motilimonas pumila]
MVNGSNEMAFGTPSSPRKYMPKQLTAGAYIEISGDYDHGLKPGNYVKLDYQANDEVWIADISGPVWITKAQDKPGEFVKIKVILTGKNIYLTDINFTQGAKPQIGSASNGYPAKNIIIRNIDVTGGISVNGESADSASDNVVIYNSTFHDSGDVNADYDQDAHLVTINAFSSNVWLLGNTLHTASGAGLQIHGGFNNSHNTHSIYVSENEVYNVRQSGLWVKSGKNIIIANNHVHDIIDTPWSVSKGIGAQYEPDGLWIINNYIHGMKYGVRVASTSATKWRQKVYVIGNVIHDINALDSEVGPTASTSSWQPAAIHLASMHEHYIYNNLIFDAPNGINISAPSSTVIANNIILDVSESHQDGETGYHILAEIQDLNEEVFIENNYFGSNMNVRVRHQLFDSAAYLNDSLGANENLLGYNFINESNLSDLFKKDIANIELSQIQDRGKDIQDVFIHAFTLAFPTTSGISHDILGSLRDFGSAVDIGPVEVE